MHRSVRRVAVLGLAAWLGLAPPAAAEIYKWTAPDGTVHFSDEPPPGAAPGVERIEPARPEVRSHTGPARYGGGRRSRMIELKKAALDLDIQHDSDLGTCRKGRQPPRMKAILYETGRAGLERLFHEELEARGFRTRLSDPYRFNRERLPPPEVSGIARITRLYFEGCTRRASMTVEWRFYDHLHRQTVLELETEGVFRRQKRNSSPSYREAIGKSFADAVSRLTEDDRIHALLDPDRGIVVTATRDGAAKPPPASAKKGSRRRLTPMSLPLRYGGARGSFARQAETLKAGSATIRTTDGHGSGFLISERHLLTNHHVVGKSRRVMVVFLDHQVEARVLRIEPERDVALLELQGSTSNEPLKIARRTPVPGEPLYVIGTPLDESLHHSVTAGVLSAERVRDGLPFYQTDAAVKPGNSGGPVFDQHGRIVGLTVSGLFTRSGASLDVNLVIPIEAALAALRIEAE